MDKFYLPQEAVQRFRIAVENGAVFERDWQQAFDAYKTAFPSEGAEFERIIAGGLPDGWDADLPKWQPTDKPIATRVAGGEVMNALAKKIPNLVGGSADLNPSTNTALKGKGDFQPAGTVTGAGAVGGVWGYAGSNMAFGVREHAMGAAVNGLALHGGVLPFSATFFVFSDYMKPAIRLGAISKLKVFYVFTHDSIGVGEDGPTHEPVEQLAGLRAIPGLTLIRPADANETADAWAFAMRHDGPTTIVLTRQNVPHLDRSGAKEPGVARGAYILRDTAGAPDVILIGTGSEVSLCVEACNKLAAQGVKARVVNMPSMSLFEAQPPEYREAVLPREVKKRVTVEAGATFGWDRYAGESGKMIGLNRYGASAKGEVVFANLGITADAVVKAATEL
jgi:transketolase